MRKRKKIFTKYLKDSNFYVSVDNAEKFESVFENLLFVLRLKYGLTSDFFSHGVFNITLYARNRSGMSDFCLRLDGDKNNQQIGIHAVSLIDISFVSSSFFSDNVKEFHVDKICSEEEVLNIMNDIVKSI